MFNETPIMRWTSALYTIVATVSILAVALILVMGFVLPNAQTVTATPGVAMMAASGAAPVSPVANPCVRPAAGSVVNDPPALFSSNGVLKVRFSYQTVIDSVGRDLFCFMTPDGLQNPTLNVKPSDQLIIIVTNNTPVGTAGMMLNAPNCGDNTMNSSSVNIHYHGTNTSPTCGQDEVIKTLVNSGETFKYKVNIPSNEPPGLYWYHPHVHGIAEHTLQGGASGAIVVAGINTLQPSVIGKRHRILIVRDQSVPGFPFPAGNVPSWDVTLNNVPITSPTNPTSNNFVPAILQMAPGEKQFWRVSNSSSDTILDLQYVFDGVPQTIHVVAIDGVAVNSQDGIQPGTKIPVTHFTLPPAARVEFIVSAPPASVGLAQLITLGINTGFFGGNDPQRPLATVNMVSPSGIRAGANNDHDGAFAAMDAKRPRFAGLRLAPIAVHRKVFFAQSHQTLFFMAVKGKPEHIFNPNAPPDIVATQGTVEQWVVQNRASQSHVFHIHQLHFLVGSQNNFELNGSQQAPALTGQYLDTIQVPAWDQNTNHAFPSVTLLIDFRGSDIGNFVFHCHILGHEDKGMMNIIQVQSP
jgi:FtsP/CotA-like multicopper oxidase with cupredoxin domain